MTEGSLGIRSSSYGSLEKHFQQYQQYQHFQQYQQNGGVMLPIQTTSRTKPAKTLKEKERLFHWIYKFAGRKKVGMLFLCIISAAVFFWVLYIGKDSQEGEVPSIRLNRTVPFSNPENETSIVQTLVLLPPPQYFRGMPCLLASCGRSDCLDA